MSKVIEAISDLKHLDDLSRGKTLIHNLHPLSKLTVTAIFLFTVVSFDKYSLTGLAPFMLYPVLMLAAAELPLWTVFKKVLLAEPLIIGIGILSPFFDPHTFSFLGWTLSSGWLVFLSIMLKGSLTVTAGFILLATTGMDRIAAALRTLKVPRIFVLQIILTYRYISVLIDEVSRLLKAHSLRSPRGRGVRRKAWGSLLGQLVLRTLRRAERIYEAMCLRGFKGEYRTGPARAPGIADFLFTAGAGCALVLARVYNISVLLGDLVKGGLL